MAKDKVPGTVVFICQPAEEAVANIDMSAKDVPSAGALRMIAEGLVERFGIHAVFGVHVMSNARTGTIVYKVGAALNRADGFCIKREGRPAHGAMPWTGADPVFASANAINGLQTLVSRRSNLSEGMDLGLVVRAHLENPTR
jgi:metal-dependent amidase/aminoacylase/carboxypeptidase family protein